MERSRPIKYRLNREKTIEALVWLSKQRPGITFYYIVKVLFFADKFHLQRYARPVLGDTYIAMEHGPVPSVVYDILKKDDFLDDELLSAAYNAIVVDGKRVLALRDPNMDVFSDSDLECLAESLQRFGNMPFQKLRELTHEELAYKAAILNGPMDYELMIDEDIPDRDSLIQEIRETCDNLVV